MLFHVFPLIVKRDLLASIPLETFWLVIQATWKVEAGGPQVGGWQATQ